MKLLLKSIPIIVAATIVAGPAGFGLTIVSASSHREAPMISGDPKADATDLYAFVSPDKTNTVTLIANYLPFEEPAGGPNFYMFGDDVLYEIKIDNNGDSIEDITYQYKFKTTTKNSDTFLYNTGPITSLDSSNWNISQTYTLTKIENGQSKILGENIPTTPSNVGPKSTPNYSNLQKQAVKQVGEGVTTFAGQSDDPFYADLGGIFDLLTIRKLPGNSTEGVDGLKGYNLQSLALQIPISQLTSNSTKPSDPNDPAAVVGVWTTSSRQSTRVLAEDGSANTSGNYVQVSRLGAPLVNEVVIPLGKKDVWNGSKPKDDAQFANYVANPELAGLLNTLYGVKVPPQGPFGTANARDDLTSIFLTGIPGLTKPANVKPSEQLRLNVAIKPAVNPNRLGVLAGDNAGYPNGRRLADDVVDISIQAMAGAAYPLFHPDFALDPLASKLGDGVQGNDVQFRSSFPYLGLPFSGFDSVPHANSSTLPVSNPEVTPVSSPAPSTSPSATPVIPSDNGLDQFQANAALARNDFITSLQVAQTEFAQSTRSKDETRDQFVNSFNQARDTYLNRLNQVRDGFINTLGNSGITAPAIQIPVIKDLTFDSSAMPKVMEYTDSINSAQKEFDNSLQGIISEFQISSQAGKNHDEIKNRFIERFSQAIAKLGDGLLSIRDRFNQAIQGR